MNLSRLLHRLRYVLLVLLVLLWAGAFTLSHLPPGDVPDFHVGDKVLHTAGFAGLASAFGVTMLAFGVPRRRRLAMLFAVMLAYGAIDEWTQPWFGRSCELRDWLHDVLGTVIAAVMVEAVAWIAGINRRGGAETRGRGEGTG